MTQASPKTVFISAASQQLANYRTVVRDALITGGILPKAQEHFSPDYRELVEFLREEIRQCDAVICLVGRMFGSSPRNQPKVAIRSYSQIEYDEASKLGKPIFVFLATAQTSFKCEPGDVEPNLDLQARFIETLQAEHKCTPFSSSDELHLRVAEMIPTLSLEITAAKIRRYVTQLRRDPEFAAWDQRRYFELRLGNQRRDFDIGLKLKSSPGAVIFSPGDEYRVPKAVKTFRRLVIIGEPGAGKTTALKRLAITFAEMFEERTVNGATVPVYVWLPRFNSVAEDDSVIGTPEERRIISLIRDAFQEHEIFRDSDLQDALEKFEMVLLLDGLNEIGDDNIDRFLEGLQVFAARYQQHLIVITSRTHNTFRTEKGLLRFTGRDIPVFELLELSYPSGVADYISCYLEDHSEAQLLIQKLESNLQIRLLAVNPLLLLMIITVFKYGRGKLPNSRGMLFEKSARGLLGEWQLQGEVRTRAYSSNDKHTLLCGLGYTMRNEGLELTTARVVEVFDATLKQHEDWFPAGNIEGLRQLSENNWPQLIDELKSDHVLFQRSDAKVVRFWHQTIQEYFAACYIWYEVRPLFTLTTLSSLAKRNLQRRMDEYIEDSRWREILAIVSGLISTERFDETPPPLSSATGQARTNTKMVEEFIERIWQRDKLLGAMCFSNTERFNDAKVMEYTKTIQREISLWGIILPRFYPWLLLMILLVPVWLLPRQTFAFLADMIRDQSGFADIAWRTAGVIIAIASGALLSLLFFRLCAFGIRKLELLTNEYFIRPGIAALKYIRNDEAERMSVQFLQRIANDFSIGPTTRATIQTGVVLPVRNESELIFMLGSERTRPQAIKRIFEVGSQQGMVEVQRMWERHEMDDDLSYATAVKELVSKAKFRPIQDSERDSLIKHLKTTLQTDRNYARRRYAYRGLVELGVTGLTPPQQRRLVWVVIGIAVLILLVTLGLLSIRGRTGAAVKDHAVYWQQSLRLSTVRANSWM